MNPGDRFSTWIDDLAQSWKDRLAGWMMGWASSSAEMFTKNLEPDMIKTMRGALEKLRDNPNLPPEYKAIIDDTMKEGNILEVVMGWMWTMLGMIPAIIGGSQSIGNIIRYDQENLFHTARLDPLSIMSLLRRSPAEGEALLKDLEDQGWDDRRIAALRTLTQVLPSARDIVGFLAHEVFEPDMVSKYGLMSEWGNIDKEYAKVIGLEEPLLEKYWMDHWQHPEWGTIKELRHRDQINDQDVKDWFRLVEIPEYWRDKMLEVLWGMPNRIEIRMMVRYLDMSKDEIIDLLKKAGLHADFRSDAADFMMIMGLTGYWGDMLSKGWMTPDEVLVDINSRGFKPITAERLYRRLVSASKPTRTAAERDITKTDIYKGVKQGRITRGEGHELLMDLGYDSDESGYLLDINIPQDQVDEVVTERQITKADILTGLKTGVLNRDEARQKLLELRYSTANTDLLLKIFDALIEPPVEAKQKEASKADIISGVKKGVITQEEGYLMLIDLGFSPEASEFILTVSTTESPFSPINFSEFKDLTGKYRKASGREVPTMPDEIIKAAADVVRLTTERDSLLRSITDEKNKLLPGSDVPAAATARITKLQTTLDQVNKELIRVKHVYDVWLTEAKRSI